VNFALKRGPVSEWLANMANLPSVLPLVLFFVGIVLCFWRLPHADRKHVALCLVAGVLWATLPIFEPSMRRSGYALAVGTFLVFS
jgi:hypothetical protein